MSRARIFYDRTATDSAEVELEVIPRSVDPIRDKFQLLFKRNIGGKQTAHAWLGHFSLILHQFLLETFCNGGFVLGNNPAGVRWLVSLFHAGN